MAVPLLPRALRWDSERHVTIGCMQLSVLFARRSVRRCSICCCLVAMCDQNVDIAQASFVFSCRHSARCSAFDNLMIRHRKPGPPLSCVFQAAAKQD
jgi:hypothetical protein